jgi:alpha-tubulin suppressor-like RCC1 family protein
MEQDYYYNYESYNKLYEISSAMIVGYPSFSHIHINKKVRGISGSKYHSLCWDEEGKIYSWGFSSLALGYG